MVNNLVNKHFTQRFLTQFGAPDTINPTAFTEEYCRALAGVEESILKEAGNLVIDQGKTFKNWPTVAECVRAVQDVAERREAARIRQTKPVPIKHRVEPSEESKERIDALVKHTTSRLRQIDEAPKKSNWTPADKAAWEKRLDASALARWLALPREYRESFGAVAEFEKHEKYRWPKKRE